ncbi:MAG: DNA integrity scanning protein DisA nucleotide-binding domain protein [Planctomycetota bacterium]|nr:DNA integrity scanning protein DisA nucleotide-binding domain protein [Planctomycetota bacterium]
MPSKFREPFASIYKQAAKLRQSLKADALMIMLDGPADWKSLRKVGQHKLILCVSQDAEDLLGAETHGLIPVVLEADDSPVQERMETALLDCVANDILEAGSQVVALYSGFDSKAVDSISVLRLGEHLGKLTARDLRQLETSVPLETLKAVVDLAIEIGHEGREGSPVGTLFVVGSTRQVMEHSATAGFDPVKGYSRSERNLKDRRTREAIKEIAQLDGAFIVGSDGVVERSCQIVQVKATSLTLSKGLGSRHWAAASISRVTNAISVVVSQSNGTVRIFQNGEVVLRIEPMLRAMKWREFEFEPPMVSSE